MATAKQSAASRANAQKSTGPRTTAGKAACRYNALKHGIHAQSQIMFDETVEDLAELDAEVRDQYKPANPTERNLVDTLIHNEWRLRRMRVVEAALWDHAGNIFLAEHTEPTCNSAHAFTAGASAFERLQRIVNSCERNYHRALKELQHQQVIRLKAEQSPQPQESTTTSESSAPFRQTPEAPAPTAPNPPETPQNPLCDSASLRQKAPTC